MAAPALIGRLLGDPVFCLGARIALTSPFWISALIKLGDVQQATGEMRHFGLEPAGLIAGLVIATQLAGSAAIILGAWTWLGAGALGVLTVLATVIAHDFWNAAPGEAPAQMTTFFEHLSMVAGLALAAILAERN